MSPVGFDALLREFGAGEILDQSRIAHFKDVLTDISAEIALFDDDEADPRQRDLAASLERIAFELPQGETRRSYAEAAFQCRRSAAPSSDDRGQELLNLLLVCVDGLLADRNAELMMLLRQWEGLDSLLTAAESNWLDDLRSRSISAFIRLCRKGGGWSDVELASAEIQELRRIQERQSDAAHEPEEVARILTLFNFARMVDIAARFLIEGEPSDPSLPLDRHWSQAGQILDIQPDDDLSLLNDALHLGCLALTRSSVWFNTRQLGIKVRGFIDEIAGAHRESPILELWPSQREALSANLLNPAKRAIVVEMPTSAGKTLLAEFAMVQALALDPDALVAYVVPTRALVNQITLRLRRDFAPLDYKVEAAVPAYELDPTEDSLLRQDIDILVLTPEKLDLLMKLSHPVVNSISLAVVDEAHNIAEGERGARLELLLAMIRRERPESRFLLLTPFVPNGGQLAEWLGDDPDGRIEVGWRPSERVAAAATFRKRRNRPQRLHFSTIPSATNLDLDTELDVDVSAVPSGVTKSKKGITTAAAISLASRGGVLVLERGRGSAEERASEIASRLPELASDEFLTAVQSFAKAELGSDHPLPDLLARGVGFHHAGLSHDLRLLVELLVDRGSIRVVTGTSTLAQGVNFPIASVIVGSTKKYVGRPEQWRTLSHAEFWNIAGRAGRALRDRIGLVVFPVPDRQGREEAESLLQAEADQISSSLMEALTLLGDAADKFDLSFVSRNPSLGVFLQYLTHALRVAGHEATSAELEDLLRSSLVYSSVRTENRYLAERLIEISRRYIEETSASKEPGYLALADGTGFSLASVDLLFAAGTQAGIAQEGFWEPSRLFADDGASLTEVVETLSRVPELSLGRGDQGPFDPEAVAGIVRDWVSGVPLPVIAERWFTNEADPAKRIRAASHYLYAKLVSQITWGVGALQRLSGLSDDEIERVGHVPSLIFFGVSSRPAIELRMAGVPRVAAEGLAAALPLDREPASSFESVREWVGALDDGNWRSALPADSPLSGSEVRMIWQALIGQAQ